MTKRYKKLTKIEFRCNHPDSKSSFEKIQGFTQAKYSLYRPIQQYAILVWLQHFTPLLHDPTEKQLSRSRLLHAQRTEYMLIGIGVRVIAQKVEEVGQVKAWASPAKISGQDTI